MAQRIVWYGAAAIVLVIAAVIGLRGAPPPPRPAPSSATAIPAPVPPSPATIPSTTGTAPGPNDTAAAEKPPSFDVVTVDPQGQAVIAGRAAPGDKVRVLDAGKLVGEATADARGEWALVPSAPLPSGDRQLSLEAVGPNGGPTRRSDDVVALSVAPKGQAAGNNATTTAVLLPGDKNKPARILSPPAANGQRLGLDSAEYGDGDRLMLAGHADPKTTLNIYAGDRLLGTATADSAGKWSLAAALPHPGGSIELRLDELGTNGKVAQRIAAPFEPDAGKTATTEKAAARGTYVVHRGNSLWLIARRVYGEGTRYTTIYLANRGQIRDPDKIYPGQQFKMPKP
ncbi:MAG TPA: LysM peptidoglycan-binding domain-containing protein [Stellaceae bacterium]|nr:LysM peptidoglycan-binding domain-containing protein [Stellaceae bacterium]